MMASPVKLERHDTSVFILFSLGPANCAGQKFAKREMLMVLSLLFKSFDMEFAVVLPISGLVRACKAVATHFAAPPAAPTCLFRLEVGLELIVQIHGRKILVLATLDFGMDL
ncbi:hypothetical protein B0H14DRAFT_2584363 [Mycena olivaceomarginata]|nr:hypothetical protein B0H14DRAFT_2584363 [Mycena olivaceomarginata]